MDDPRTRVFDTLDTLGLSYDRYDHPPVFTGEQAALYWAAIPGTQVKNLFLRNKKGDRHYLAILEIHKQADLRRLVKIVGDDRFSFASAERLMAHLGVTPGSVSPFGLINDDARRVIVMVDEDLRRAERLLLHPNINTATVTISGQDLERFLVWRGNPLKWLKLGP
jgi:Ala-tRNA(Pro) deacylase